MSADAGRVEAFRHSLAGRAAGLWRVEGDRLIQAAFAAAADMPADVADAFAAATRSVPLDRRDLGIVGAFLSGEPAVSVARDLPADAGSGYWLRAFGAVCSVAVPLGPPGGRATAVLSVALPAEPANPAAMAFAARAFAAGEGWA